MLRIGNTIRLTEQERLLYESLTGKGLPAPTTVEEHNRRLDESVKDYASRDTAEERLLASIAESLKIPDTENDGQ